MGPRGDPSVTGDPLDMTRMTDTVTDHFNRKRVQLNQSQGQEGAKRLRHVVDARGSQCDDERSDNYSDTSFVAPKIPSTLAARTRPLSIHDKAQAVLPNRAKRMVTFSSLQGAPGDVHGEYCWIGQPSSEGHEVDLNSDLGMLFRYTNHISAPHRLQLLYAWSWVR